MSAVEDLKKLMAKMEADTLREKQNQLHVHLDWILAHANTTGYRAEEQQAYYEDFVTYILPLVNSGEIFDTNREKMNWVKGHSSRSPSVVIGTRNQLFGTALYNTNTSNAKIYASPKSRTEELKGEDLLRVQVDTNIEEPGQSKSCKPENMRDGRIKIFKDWISYDPAFLRWLMISNCIDGWTWLVWFPSFKTFVETNYALEGGRDFRNDNRFYSVPVADIEANATLLKFTNFQS
jgi:hypothetical protein